MSNILLIMAAGAATADDDDDDDDGFLGQMLPDKTANKREQCLIN